jgi:hypothetical protein
MMRLCVGHEYVICTAVKIEAAAMKKASRRTRARIVTPEVDRCIRPTRRHEQSSMSLARNASWGSALSRIPNQTVPAHPPPLMLPTVLHTSQPRQMVQEGRASDQRAKASCPRSAPAGNSEL